MDVIEELQERLRRYPEERYPIQHATAQFHLGVLHANAGRQDEAQEALAAAARLFDAEALPAEHGKAVNALGAALRAAGRLDEAETAFGRAVEAFERAGLRRERGAALFNIGLVRRELGRPDDALAAFRTAAQLVDVSPVLRELGTTLLALARLGEAVDALEQAVERAGGAEDAGAAANVLGLALLASGRPAEAADAFARSAGAHPRPLRPQEYAMAKANLALAYEQLAQAPRARLAARQALGVADAPAPVAAQAAAMLERLGREPGDLVLVLEDEPADRWPPIVREELARWTDAPAEGRRAEAAAWVAGQLERPGRGPELAEAWLGGLLELPPAAMEALIRDALEAAGDRSREERRRWVDDVRRAAARFHPPQMQRLERTFARVAGELGHEDSWS